MDIEKIIKDAKDEAMLIHNGWTPKLEEAIRSGLCDGDKIGLGGDLVAVVDGDCVRMVHKKTETAVLRISELSDAQFEIMLRNKGIQVGRVSYSIG